MPLDKKDIKKNIAYTFGAQTLQLVLSVIMTLVVPKLLGIEAFSYWQLFIFYTSYGGFLHFGLYDGIYLRLGGLRYADLNKRQLEWQMRASVVWQTAICLIIAAGTFFLVDSSDRLFVIVCSCLCTLASNSICFFGYVLQATNNIRQYSMSLMIEKSLFLAFVVSSLFVSRGNFRSFILLYIFCRLVALSYNGWHCRDIVKALGASISPQWNELKENIKCGLTLTFSNISSMLILGIGRFLIDTNFGIVEFGKVSFAIIMTNFFLVFMNQTSLVLFPALRRLSGKELETSFTKLNRLLTAFTPMILLLYMPISIFIRFWLPDYTDSLSYLVFLLPLCCYDGKMQMLNNTFLKVLREEEKLLFFNVVACAVSGVLTVTAVYAFRSMTLVVLSMLLALCLRSTIAEAFLSHRYNLRMAKDMALLTALAAAFILLNLLCSSIVAAIAFVCLYCLYLLHYRNSFSLIKNIK